MTGPKPTIIRARFDGKVFVPEGPVDLPTDRVFEVQVTEVQATATREAPLMRLAKALEGLPSDPNAPTDGAAQHDHYLYGTPKRANP
jgi:hypothetical protein